MNSRTPHVAAAVAASGSQYRRMGRRRLMVLAAAAAAVLVALVIDVMTGPATLSVGQVLAAVCTPEHVEPAHRTILWTFRMPTALMAAAVGAALAVAGVQMQTILNNPLASPYTLGVSAAASFGAALAMIVPVALPLAVAVPASAFVFAMLSCMAIFAVARLRGAGTETVVLGGVALLFLFNSGVALMQYLASENQLQAIVFWIFGSLQGATWEKLAVVSCVLASSMVLLAMSSWRLTALRLGESHARSLGVDVQRLRLRTLALVSVLTAAAVCFAGAIGFIGLVAPHLARRMVGEDQRYLLPLSALLGAVLLTSASAVCKAVLPGAVLPVGIATAVLGVPFFAAMILTSRKSYW
ncbi:MAG: iron ABC transporter permease [Planctomycetaceae bacterium]|nr:iron ABC transporter permease [Planctomycetaceae bacterium]